MRFVLALMLALGIGAPLHADHHRETRVQVIDKTDPLDDTRFIGLVLFERASPKEPRNMGLFVRCSEETLSVYVSVQYVSGQQLESHTLVGDEEVAYRFDKKPPHKEQWRLSTNHESLFAPRPRVLPFVEALAQARTLYIRITPNKLAGDWAWVNTPYFDATFDLKVQGLAKGLRTLRQACSW